MKFRPLSIPYASLASDFITDERARLKEIIAPIDHVRFTVTKENDPDEFLSKEFLTENGEIDSSLDDLQGANNETITNLTTNHVQENLKTENPDAEHIPKNKSIKKVFELDECSIFHLLGSIIYPSDCGLRPISKESSIQSFQEVIDKNKTTKEQQDSIHLMSLKVFFCDDGQILIRNQRKWKENRRENVPGAFFHETIQLLTDPVSRDFSAASSNTNKHDHDSTTIETKSKKCNSSFKVNESEDDSWKTLIRISLSQNPLPFLRHVIELPDSLDTIKDENSTNSHKNFSLLANFSSASSLLKYSEHRTTETKNKQTLSQSIGHRRKSILRASKREHIDSQASEKKLYDYLNVLESRLLQSKLVNSNNKYTRPEVNTISSNETMMAHERFDSDLFNLSDWFVKRKREWRRQRALMKSNVIVDTSTSRVGWFQSRSYSNISSHWMMNNSIRLDPSWPLISKESKQNNNNYSKLLVKPPNRKILEAENIAAKIINSKGHCNGKLHTPNYRRNKSKTISTKEDLTTACPELHSFVNKDSLRIKIENSELFPLNKSFSRSIKECSTNDQINRATIGRNLNTLQLSSVTDPGKSLNYLFVPYVPSLISVDLPLPCSKSNLSNKSENKQNVSISSMIDMVKKITPIALCNCNKVLLKCKKINAIRDERKDYHVVNNSRCSHTSLKTLTGINTFFIPHISKCRERDILQEVNQKRREGHFNAFIELSKKSRDESIERHQYDSQQIVAITGCRMKREQQKDCVYYGFLSGEIVPPFVYQHRYETILRKLSIVTRDFPGHQVSNIPSINNLKKTILSAFSSKDISFYTVYYLSTLQKKQSIQRNENPITNGGQSSSGGMCFLKLKRHPYLRKEKYGIDANTYETRKATWGESKRDTSSFLCNPLDFFDNQTKNYGQICDVDLSKSFVNLNDFILNDMERLNEESIGIRGEFLHLSKKAADLKKQDWPNSPGKRLKENDEHINYPGSSFFYKTNRSSQGNQFEMEDELGQKSNKKKKTKEKKKRKKRDKKESRKKRRSEQSFEGKRKVLHNDNNGENNLLDESFDDIKYSLNKFISVSPGVNQRESGHDSLDDIKRSDKKRAIKIRRVTTDHLKLPIQISDPSDFIDTPMLTKDHIQHAYPTTTKASSSLCPGATSSTENDQRNSLNTKNKVINYHDQSHLCSNNLQDQNFEKSSSYGQNNRKLDAVNASEKSLDLLERISGREIVCNLDKVLQANKCMENTTNDQILSENGNDFSNNLFGTNEKISPEKEIVLDNGLTLYVTSPKNIENSDSLSNQGNGMKDIFFKSDAERELNFAPSDAKPKVTTITILCSETFLETSGEIVSDLATGQWTRFASSLCHDKNVYLTQGLPPFLPEEKGRKIIMCDSPLIDESGVDFELPSQRCIVIERLSSWCDDQSKSGLGQNMLFDHDRHTAKSLTKRLVHLVSTRRYNQIHVFLCIDTPITQEISSEISLLQNALIIPSACPSCRLNFHFVSPKSISYTIAETVLMDYPNSLEYDCLAAENLCSCMKVVQSLAQDMKVQERARFMLSMAPTLTVIGALQCIISYSTNIHTDECSSIDTESILFDFQKFVQDFKETNRSKIFDLIRERGPTEVTERSIYQLATAIATRLTYQR